MDTGVERDREVLFQVSPGVTSGASSPVLSAAAPSLWRLLPLLVPFVLLFGGGLALAVAQSLGWFLPLPWPPLWAPLWEGGRFAAYLQVLTPRYAGSFVLSIGVALASALLSVAGGALLAWFVWRLPRRLGPWAVVYKIPLILPHIAVAFIVLVFWSRSGLVAALCWHLGLIDRAAGFPSPLFNGTGLGMVMAYVYKETPFVVLLAHAALRRLDERLIQAARMLGGSRLQIFRAVVLPHLAPVLRTTFIILFCYTFGAFEIPYLLGESTPGMLSIEVWNLYFQRDLAERPVAMALLTLMFLFAAACIVVYARLARRLGAGMRKL